MDHRTADFSAIYRQNARRLDSLISPSCLRQRSVAIGNGSFANVADTVSVGNSSLKRRIVNVAPGTQPNAVNLAQPTADSAVAGLQQEVTALRTMNERLIQVFPGLIMCFWREACIRPTSAPCMVASYLTKQSG
jgi:hypothetical protein